MVTKSETNLPMAVGRAEQMQFLRFLAFLNIFICHAEYWNFMNYPASHCGYFAVSFFIMLSGWAAGYSRYGREISPTPKNIAGDMAKKLKRLYPMYILVLMMSLVFSFIPQPLKNGEWSALGANVLTLLQNLLLIQSWPGGQRYLWFMSTIMFLYLLTLPSLWLIRKARGHRFRYIFWGGAFLVLMVAVVVYCRSTQDLYMYYWHYIFPPARIGEYVGGILLGYALRDFLSQPVLNKIPKWLFTMGEAAALAFWVASMWRPGNYWMNHTVSWLIPNTLMLTAFTFGRGHISGLLRWKPLVYLGDISFECYLLHQAIIQRCYLLNPDSIHSVPAQIYSFTICLVLTVYASSLFHNAAARRKGC